MHEPANAWIVTAVGVGADVMAILVVDFDALFAVDAGFPEPAPP